MRKTRGLFYIVNVPVLVNFTLDINAQRIPINILLSIPIKDNAIKFWLINMIITDSIASAPNIMLKIIYAFSFFNIIRMKETIYTKALHTETKANIIGESLKITCVRQ